MKKYINIKKIVKIILVSIVSIIVISAVGMYVYLSFTYAPDAIAQEALLHENVEVLDGMIAVYDETPSDTALIFYPGGKVQYEAYLPLLIKLQEKLNMTCVMVEMPFNIAVFNSNAGNKILKQFPEITKWNIVGHSVGGAAASMYAVSNPDIIQTLTLLGSYNYAGFPEEKTLTIYGSFNPQEEINYTQNIYVIEGGNHAKYGNYGRQRGDVDGTISREEQQNQTVEIMAEFIK